MTPAETSDVQGTMSFREHLGELRTRLFKATLAVFVGFFVAWNFHIELYALLSSPVRQALANNNLFAIKALQITESIEVYMKLSLFGGLVLASPFVFYQLWAFVAPGLLDKEKRLIGPVIAGSVACFLLGAAFCHLIVLPFMTDFLIKLTVEAPGMTLEPTLASTVSFSVLMLVAFGAVFELPLFMYVLAALGLVSAKGFLGFYRYWVVIAFIIGAVLTPTPDPINQTLMSAPLVLLYGVGVIIAWLVQRQPGKKISRRAVFAVSTVLVALATLVVVHIVRDREPGPLDDVPADVRQLIGVHLAGLPRIRQQITPGSEAAMGLAPLGLLDALGIKPSDPQLILARFEDGAALLVQVADAKAVVTRIAKARQASVVRAASGPSVWFTVPGAATWRAVAAGQHALWLGDDGGLAHLSAVRQKRKPALVDDKTVDQRLADLRGGGPLWSYVPARKGIAGWLPGGALVDSVLLAAAVVERDKKELTLRFDCKGPEAAIALRDRIEAWVADSRRATGPASDRQMQQLAGHVQELADLVAKAAEASSRVAPANSPDRQALVASAGRAASLSRELTDLGHPPGVPGKVEAVPTNDGPLVQAVQPPSVSSTTAGATSVVWVVQGDMGRLLDVLTAPASAGLSPDAVRDLKTVRPAAASTSPLPMAPVAPR